MSPCLHIDICVTFWASLIVKVCWLTLEVIKYFKGIKIHITVTKIVPLWYPELVLLSVEFCIFLPCSLGFPLGSPFFSHRITTYRSTDWLTKSLVGVNNCMIINDALWWTGVPSTVQFSHLPPSVTKVGCRCSETNTRIKWLLRMNEGKNHTFISESVLMEVSSVGNGVTNLMRICEKLYWNGAVTFTKDKSFGFFFFFSYWHGIAFYHHLLSRQMYEMVN